MFRKVSPKKPRSVFLSMPRVDFLIINQLAESPVAICRVFWLAMMRTRNSTSAGAIMFSAVPPIVWSARRLMDAKDSSSEKMAPIMPAASIASSSRPCSVTQSPAALAARMPPLACMMRTNITPMKAPKIMIPSRARLMIPLRSANTPASATIINGIA